MNQELDEQLIKIQCSGISGRDEYALISYRDLVEKDFDLASCAEYGSQELVEMIEFASINKLPHVDKLTEGFGYKLGLFSFDKKSSTKFMSRDFLLLYLDIEAFERGRVLGWNVPDEDVDEEIRPGRIRRRIRFEARNQ